MDAKLKYFGTDGIRGEVGKFPINAEFVLKLGWGVGRVLARQGGEKVLIGKDTRISGYMFEAALQAGFSAAGVDVHLLGPIPTPAIAYLTRTLRADIGVVISASHNLYTDNGIKFFSAEGWKLDDATELAIEKQLQVNITTVSTGKLGRVYRVGDACGRYIEFCKSCVPHYASFKGLKIVLDCANGATYNVAPQVFDELQATVLTINDQPDGYNINQRCGSVDPKQLQKMVKKTQAQVGIAFDGDGDRVLMVDDQGDIVDGDELIYIIARHHAKHHQLHGVVGTQMSNFGLERAINEIGVPFERTPVGDRYVLSALKKNNWLIGGEPSGHIICLDMTTTGDGIISALQILQVMQEEGKSLRELKAGMQKFPQTMINIPLKKDSSFLQAPDIQSKIQKIESQLKGQGRVLIRPSGTEPIIRIMVEGHDEKLTSKLANELAKTLK